MLTSPNVKAHVMMRAGHKDLNAPRTVIECISMFQGMSDWHLIQLVRDLVWVPSCLTAEQREEMNEAEWDCIRQALNDEIVRRTA